jgi:hypothetical protein
VVWHIRTTGGRYKVTRMIIEAVGDRTDFELLLRKPV